MGKGLALQFKEKYEGTLMFKCYQHYCKYGKYGHNLDKLLYKGGSIAFWYFSKVDESELWLTPTQQNYPRHHVLHFATKEFWRNPSKVEWIEEGLYNFANGIRMIALPVEKEKSGYLLKSRRRSLTARTVNISGR